MIPNLFIVGFQKCGSSLLFDLLTKHPDIKGTNPKETFFLSDKAYENYNPEKNINNNTTSWEAFVSSPHKISKYFLEASVCNFSQNTALEYISNQVDSKVIFILRDPVERFISNFKYYSGNIPKIRKDLNIEMYYENIINGIYAQDSLKHAIDHGKYSKYINTWTNLLGEDKIHLVSFKKLISEPQEELSKIYRFLDISLQAENKNQLKKVNESKKIKNRSFHIFLIKYFSSDFPLKNFFKKVYYKMFSTKVEVNVPESLKAKLKAAYKEEYKLFGKYF